MARHHGYRRSEVIGLIKELPEQRGRDRPDAVAGILLAEADPDAAKTDGDRLSGVTERIHMVDGFCEEGDLVEPAVATGNPQRVATDGEVCEAGSERDRCAESLSWREDDHPARGVEHPHLAVCDRKRQSPVIDEN